MKSGLQKTVERLLTAVLALLLVSGGSLAQRAQAAERAPEDYVFTDYGYGYDLVSFLNGYNVLAFGNVQADNHLVGAILVNGNYSTGWGNSGFADGVNLPPSFVKGSIYSYTSRYNSRNNPDALPFYVGSSNTISYYGIWGPGVYVNGLPTGYSVPAYVNDDFFNFQEAYEVIKANQATMAARGTVVTPVNGVVTVNVGDNVVIESMKDVNTINIVGDPLEKVNTTITILDGGNMNLPRLHINSQEPAVLDQNEAGTSVVFNLPNASSVKIPTQNWLGHIIAPDADVSQYSANFNGCIICDDLYTSAEGHVYAYNTTDTSWETSFSLLKVWDDGNNADGIRPDFIEVELLANGTRYGDPVRLSEKNGWYYVWPTLPEKDSAGKPIKYTVRELNVPEGYTASYDEKTQTLTNTHKYGTVDITGTKTWTGESLFGSRMRPMYLTVYLYADGKQVASQTITVTSADTQTYTFKDLPKYKNDQEIVYTVQEEAVPGYIGTVDGYDLTNTWGVTPIVISGTKTWNDDNNRDGLRPTSVTIELLANGEVLDERVATAVDGWTYTFTNLPETDQNGNAITYTVREKDVPDGYTSTVNGYDIVNEHKSEVTNLSGKKTWVDDDNNDGLRPDSITITLLQDGKEYDSRTVTAADGWAWEFKDVPKKSGGKLITYTVAEEPVAGYTATVNGMNLTNTHVSERVNVSGKKTWVDDDNNDGLRPDSITITLLQDGKEYDSRTVTEADGWAWTFSELPKYTGGKEHVYTIAEAPVAGYTAEVKGYDVINTHVSETIDVLGHKVWNDNDDNDGLRPSRLTIYLLVDGVQNGYYRTTTADRNWYWLFVDLPKYENGREIVYSFEEEAVEGYTGPVITQMTTLPEGYGDIGYELTNTHTEDTVRISGAKTWNDANDQDGLRPDSITIRLWKTIAATADAPAVREEVASRTVTAADGWAWSFGEQPRYENGQEIVYTITEDAVAGYSATIRGYDVENTYTPGQVTISGQKTWNDAEDQDGLRPDSITVRLHKTVEGVTTEIDSTTVTPDADGRWAWSFTGLDEYEDGQKIVYTITEDAVPGYQSVVDQYDLINLHTPETVEVSGQKTWIDADNQDGLRPVAITIRLWKTVNGQTEEIRNAAITEKNGWKWRFVNLPKYENGQEIVYTITEDEVEGYTATISGTDVINTHEAEKTIVSGRKTWVDAANQDGKRPASITINLLRDGQEIDEKTVTAEDGWAWSFTDLPKYENGREIVYTITEDEVAEYTAEVSGYDVTNTYHAETTEINGHKIWADSNNRDGKRPESITIRLWANGEEIDSRTVTAANGWMWSFTGLAKYSSGSLIAYTITEDAVPGYTTEVDGYNVTNSYRAETTEVSGSKIWQDDDDRDGKRPASITIRLLANGEERDACTVTAASGWKWSFTDLPKYKSGQEIVYTVTEDSVPGYTTEIDGYTVINRYAPETTSVSGRKFWSDGSNQDGKRPTSITINLLANGKKIDQKTVTAADGWAWNFTNLAKYEDGQEIVYTITEENVAGYTTVVSGYNVMNIYTPETTSVSGTKTWNDNDNQDGKRPASITINLLANGTEVAEKTVTAADNWAWSFTNLPKYESGQEIVYSITEDAVADYTTVVSGYNVVNTYETETTSVSGAKTWNDNDNQDGKRPASITINLLANGTEVAEKTVTAADGWAWSFTNLAKYESGKEIVYSITEDAVTDYTTVVSGYNVTNTYETETTSVSGAKTWNDNNNQDGKRPASITIRLWGNGVETASKTVTAADGWAWSFTNLPKYESGKEIVYSITEDAVTDYTTVVSGYNVTNTYETETTSVSGAKTWNDNNNQDGKRPASITINLLANGTEVAEKTVTAADNWAWSFTNLPKYESGKEIVYSITEDAVTDYTTVVSGYNVVNTYETETISVSGAKTWNDNNNQDGKRPTSITIRLWGNGIETASKTVTAADNWAWSFTNLPKYENGKEIVYSITEDAVADYTTVVSGYNVVNTYETETTSVSGTKTWNDNNNQDGKRPASITINLLANGTEVAEKTVTAADGWAWSFTNLPKYESGKEIVYSITEDAVTDYMTVVSGYNVTNTYETETTSVSGAKTWNDNNNQDGKRPTSITIRLWGNGVETASKTVTAADGWAWTFTGLPKYAGGKLIVYTITEDAVPGYTTVVSGYNVTNSCQTETTSVTGSKTWQDDNDRDGVRPASITINLLANGVKAAEKTVTAADGWQWSFTGLPKYADGKLIVYTIAEEPVADYTTMIVGYDVINSRQAEKTSISGQKFWFDEEDAYGVRPVSITIRLLADGVEVAEKTVTEEDDWAWIFTDLPVNRNGSPITYTIIEDEVPEYETFIVGYDVYNTYDRTSFHVTKVWEGEEGGMIDLTLYADGVRVNPQPPIERYGDLYVWEDLPLFNEDGEEIVYSAKEAYMDGYMTIYENVGEYAGETDRVYDGGTIINRGVVNLFVRKVWEGLPEGTEVPKIQLTLYRNGVATDVPTPDPDANGWYRYYNLPTMVDGELVRYTVRENATDGYMAIYTTTNGADADEAVNGTVITNIRIPATGDDSHLLLWAGVMMASAALLLVLRRRGRT